MGLKYFSMSLVSWNPVQCGRATCKLVRRASSGPDCPGMLTWPHLTMEHTIRT